MLSTQNAIVLRVNVGTGKGLSLKNMVILEHFGKDVSAYFELIISKFSYSPNQLSKCRWSV